MKIKMKKMRFRGEISTKFKNVTWHALPPKSPSVDWTAQCITTPSEFLQTTHQPPTYSSPISSPLLLIPPLNRCPSMYALHLKGSEQSVTLTPPAPSDSRTARWKTSDRLTGWLFRCQILLLLSWSLCKSATGQKCKAAGHSNSNAAPDQRSKGSFNQICRISSQCQVCSWTEWEWQHNGELKIHSYRFDIFDRLDLIVLNILNDLQIFERQVVAPKRNSPEQVCIAKSRELSIYK